MTDDKDVEALENRIDELETTIQRMLPNRREVIGMAGAGLAGAGLMAGTASAGTNQVGSIGSDSKRVDIEAEDIDLTDQPQTPGTPESGQVRFYAKNGEPFFLDDAGNENAVSGGVIEVSTFADLPAIDPPQLAFVTDESEYYHSGPVSGTPFDIASASFTTSINTQDSSPLDMAFDNNGTRLYEVGNGGDKIYQSSLSTPFDIASASFTKSINTQDSGPQGMAFDNNGTRLYEVGNGGDKIYQSQVATVGWVAF
jgi:hypothetical protein